MRRLVNSSCGSTCSGFDGTMVLKSTAGLVALVVLLQVPRQIDCHTNCPRDWTEYSSYCYYHNSNEYTWEAAVAWCRSAADGSDLVSILSSGENSHVLGMISIAIHIGFNDVSLEGDWQWTDGRSVTYTNWNGGEPSGNNGLGNHGGMYTSGTWMTTTAPRQNAPSFVKLPENGRLYRLDVNAHLTLHVTTVLVVETVVVIVGYHIRTNASNAVIRVLVAKITPNHRS
ncbi:uncharacterized protein [Ptychodera flava]|uniref:uncharacterized protein n=1 Tax=Ptychodera flava TaxID=63121 RepID=UPI00396A7B51